MRSLVYALTVLGLVGLAWWAYRENYATQDALRRVEALQKRIAERQDRLAVLRAEWAYLNRPERLRDLVELNWDSLRLQPLAPEHFALPAQVAYPRVDPAGVRGPVDVSSAGADGTAGGAAGPRPPAGPSTPGGDLGRPLAEGRP